MTIQQNLLYNLDMINALGAVFTSNELADFVSEWAIRSANNTVLDLGLGEGAFVFSSFKRLQHLGAIKEQAALQIFGTEIDEGRFKTLKSTAKNLGVVFPNLHYQDFFEAQFPQVDVVIGNPPYVRRRKLSPENVNLIRSRVLEANTDIEEKELSQLTDVYVYFLLKAATHLKPNGKLAVVIPDSWLNVRYGEILRGYFKKHFEIDRIISFDRPIFDDAQVKPVLVFATKKSNKEKPLYFTRVMNGLPIRELAPIFDQPEPILDDVNTSQIYINKFDDKEPWGSHFRIAQILDSIANHKKLMPLSSIANSRIGLQTLAKDFFVFTNEQASSMEIESEYLTPIIHSIADVNGAVIDKEYPYLQQLFFCNKIKSELVDTKALAHIWEGEQEKVQIRGRDEFVFGYQNKPRIKKANRPHWYDVKTSIIQRGIAPILIPRLVYTDFRVLWNQAQFVPGGAIIEVLPTSSNYDIRVLLALLNSSFTEVILRGSAQMYGGGMCTLSVSKTKSLPIIDINSLSQGQREHLVQAYNEFCISGQRYDIDNFIWDFLGLSPNPFKEALKMFRLMATYAKKK